MCPGPPSADRLQDAPAGARPGHRRPRRARHWLFAYGSLVGGQAGSLTRSSSEDGFVADLAGFRRTWGVAMDNRRDIAGYKYYVDPTSGDRPHVFVAFLDLEPSPDTATNGLVLPVTPGVLTRLDRRELQYQRIDVSGRFPSLTGPVWVYVGSAAGRARRRAGDRRGATVVVRAYEAAVRRGFAALGAGEQAAFEASTSPCTCPRIELVRRDIPGPPRSPSPARW